MLDKLGAAGLLGVLLMVGGVAVVALESLLVAGGIALVVAGPDDETQTLELSRDAGRRTLDSGESVTFDQRLNPETPGTHGLQVRLFGQDRSTRYDSSDALTVTVREPSPGLGGPIDRAEVALGALVGVMGYVVRRN